jgi:hypothetical protein
MAGNSFKHGEPTFERSIETNAGLHNFLTPPDRIDQILFTGIIIDSFQYAHCYYVQADLNIMVLATSLNHTSLTPMGWRSGYQYLPGTKVLCYRNPTATDIYILGALNLENPNDSSLNMADWIQQGSNASFKDNLVHNFVSTLNPKDLLRNYNNHRPVDMLPGEWGMFNTLGMGLFLGTTMAMMRASEIAGLWVFQTNNAVRLAAYNYQLWTAAREQESFNDQSELNDMVRISPYPWEMSGAVTYNTDITQPATTATWSRGDTSLANEPLAPDQTGIFRFHQFRGYLGDVERTIVSCPPLTPPSPVETLSAKSLHIGLSETVRHADGLLYNRSAKGIYHVKELLIPVPKQLATHDDPQGDSLDANNYKFAGTVGGGAPHDQTEITLRRSDPQIRSAAFPDWHAWAANSYGQAGFALHAKDWYYPQESEIADGLNLSSDTPPQQQPMGLNAWAAMPNVITITVDSRPGHTHRYYQSRSVRAQSDDGGIFDEDAWGSVFKMAGGNVTISPPGDIYLAPGRNVVIMAPRDAIVRAGNCLDLSAAKGDLRAHAYKNLHMMGGNSGTGGILLEGRGTGFDVQFAGKVGIDVVSSGVVLVAKKSQILTYAQRTYVRSTNSGFICLDADNGRGSIYQFASQQFWTVKTNFNTAYGVRPNTAQRPLVTEVHSRSQVFFGQKRELFFNGTIVTLPKATLLLGKSLLCKGTGAFSGNVLGRRMVHRRKPGLVAGPWHGLGSGVLQAFTQAATRAQALATLVQDERDQIKEEIYSSTGVGSPALARQIGYSCRSDTQYGITGLLLYESRWQQWARQQGAAQVWDEPTVKSPGGQPTLPFPGFANWKNKRLFMTLDSKLFNDQAGYNKNRRYTNPATAVPASVTLAKGYLVTAQD